MTTPQPAPASPLAPAWLPAPGDPDALVPGLWAAGYKHNVIPSSATGTVDVRLIPGEE
ncbi:hypothetical protein JRF99_10630, partial [Micrococcus luteus]|nr:hypothetical protein [Micrococcus luteus]